MSDGPQVRDDPLVDDDIPSGRTLGDTATHGVKWSFIGTFASQVARLATAFVLARILGPNDFGVVALAYVYIALVSVLVNQAFSVVVVQRARLSRRELGTVTALNGIVVALLMLVTIVGAPLVADFFHEPQLALVLRVLSVGMVFDGLAAIPLGQLTRALRFADIAKIQLASTFVSSVIPIAAAIAGAGVWALVIQGLLAPGVLLVGGLLYARPVLTRHWVAVRSILLFSVPLMAAQCLGFLGGYADNFLIGRFEGAVQLAFYAVAYRLMIAFMDVVTGVIGRVSLPLYSRASADQARLERGVIVSVRAATTGSFGLMTLSILVAPVAIPLLLGNKWEPTVVPLQFLMAASFARVMLVILGPLAMALARTDLVMLWSAIIVGVTVLGFAIGLQWGINGVAASYVVTSFVVLVPNAVHVGHALGFDFRRFLLSAVPAAVASAVMAAVWFGVDAGVIAAGGSDVAAAVVASLAGLGAYGATLRWVFPRAFQEIWGLGMALFRRQPSAPVA